MFTSNRNKYFSLPVLTLIIVFFILFQFISTKKELNDNNLASSAKLSQLVNSFQPFQNNTQDKRHDICIITFWEGDKFANYHPLFFNSANSSSTKIWFFYEEQNMVNIMEKFTNIESHRIPDLNRFFSDKICGVFDENLDGFKCTTLMETLKLAEKTGKGSPLAQLRMFGAEIFKDWVSEKNCKSWATIDNDMVIGDVNKFVRNNPLYFSSDLITFGHGDVTKLYTRGPFTAQPFTEKEPIWRHCPHVSSMDRLIETFATGNFFGLDEGCYMYAAAFNDYTFTIFPYLADGWRFRKTAVLEDGRFYLSEENDIRRVPSPNAKNASVTSLLIDIFPVHKPIEFLKNTGCMNWVHPEYRRCLPNPRNSFDILQFSQGKAWVAAEYAHKDTFYEEYAFFHINWMKKNFIIEKNLNQKLMNERMNRVHLRVENTGYNFPKSWGPIVDELEHEMADIKPNVLLVF